jgi:hypothetical protein
MNTLRLNTRGMAPAARRRAPPTTLMTLLTGPIVLAALLLSLFLMAFNLWPTFSSMSEWSD